MNETLLAWGASAPVLAPNLPPHFWLGYMALLLVPGPNSFLIATVTSVRGFWASLPLVLSISAGAAALASLIGILAASAVDDTPLRSWLPQISALLLLGIAWRIATLNPPVAGCVEASHHNIADIALGFTCGLTNPVTALYFGSQLIVAGRIDTASSIVVLSVGVAACATLFMLGLACILALPWARDAVRSRLPAIKLAAVSVFTVMAVTALWPNVA